MSSAIKQNLKHWDTLLTIKEAIDLQRTMAQQVIEEDHLEEIKTIGGMDVSNNLFDPTHSIYAAVVVLDPEKRIVEQSSLKEKQTFPYRTGLLAFREAPALIRAFQGLKHKPSLIMVDGHGICHPRRLGIASHIGVLLDIPTIGVGKNILVGTPDAVPENAVGSKAYIRHKGKIVGALLRTKARTHPLIISVGHKVSLETALSIVLNSVKGYRLPEPTRQAHLAANALRKSFVS
jgi:deoxyribonuclease V